MMQNPLVQTVLLIFGSYTAMSLVKKHPPFGGILTAVAGVMAVTIWMLRFNRQQAAALYRNPMLKPVIDLVCALCKETPPVDGTAAVAAPATSAAASAPARASTAPPATAGGRARQPVSARAYQDNEPSSTGRPAGENSRLLLNADSDFRAFAYRLKERMVGCDETIDQTVAQIQRNIRLRERSVARGVVPPLGMFLYIGRAGLGKKTVAVETGTALYGGGSVGVIDFGEQGTSLSALVASARANPYQTFIIENLSNAPQQVQTDLLTIFSGAPIADPSSGATVTFRNCFFFLIVHKDAASFPKPVASSSGTGFTVVVNHLASALEVDSMLALSLHGVCPFRLPEPMDQARVVVRLMEDECEKYNLTLESVSTEVVAREVEEVSRLSSFKASPMRIARILSTPIGNALARQSTSVAVGQQQSRAQELRG